ncbi:MAG: creatininase family protein, partial [Acidimicrobiia bacterium]|nr:creatininase family protein [Acidimicrobiia bacterium]
LTHGGGIEAMAVMARDPDLVHIERAGDATRPDLAIALDEMRRDPETHGYITDVTEIDDDGWYGNPSWATPELAEAFATTTAMEITKRVESILALRSDG